MGCKWNMIFRFVPLENFRKKRNSWKGSPVFPVETSQWKFVFHLQISRLYDQFHAFRGLLIGQASLVFQQTRRILERTTWSVKSDVSAGAGTSLVSFTSVEFSYFLNNFGVHRASLLINPCCRNGPLRNNGNVRQTPFWGLLIIDHWDKHEFNRSLFLNAFVNKLFWPWGFPPSQRMAVCDVLVWQTTRDFCSEVGFVFHRRSTNISWMSIVSLTSRFIQPAATDYAPLNSSLSSLFVYQAFPYEKLCHPLVARK